MVQVQFNQQINIVSSFTHYNVAFNRFPLQGILKEHAVVITEVPKQPTYSERTSTCIHIIPL